MAYNVVQAKFVSLNICLFPVIIWVPFGERFFLYAISNCWRLHANDNA